MDIYLPSREASLATDTLAVRIRRKVLTAMHDGMSTFLIVTTSDPIGLDSKTAKRLRFKVHFV